MGDPSSPLPEYVCGLYRQDLLLTSLSCVRAERVRLTDHAPTSPTHFNS